jgi:hypothetical protein
MKKLPIGISSFEKIITDNYYYIDKTLLIKELLDSGAAATLIPRPRRFGKTLNMSMLQCFFEKRDKEVASLFDGLNITQHPDCMKHQGQYPVIFFTFKDIKTNEWEICWDKLKTCIQQEFIRHEYVLQSDALSGRQKNDMATIINGTGSYALYSSALKDLSTYLLAYYSKKPIILIDEYDSPIHAGFVNNYYDHIIDFMRGFLGASLKDNTSLKFAVMTGILRVAKESIFSGLNNLDVCSLISTRYTDKFGLVESEVEKSLQEFTCVLNLNEIRNWYNGYTVGKRQKVYNPWSIMKVLQEGILQAYWINTSDNEIIKNLIVQSPLSVKKDLESLLAGNALQKKINDNIAFASLPKREDAVWNFLLFSGYLSFDSIELVGAHLTAYLRLPNVEVRSFYETVVLGWLEDNLRIDLYQDMLRMLTSGDIKSFTTYFKDIVYHSLSWFDVQKSEPERFYHALVLGMLVSLRERYIVDSNRESGYGRYDVLLIPRNPEQEQFGFVIEFKKVTDDHPTLERAAQAALDQIEAMQYEARLKEVGTQTVIKLGIAFQKEETLVLQA